MEANNPSQVTGEMANADEISQKTGLSLTDMDMDEKKYKVYYKSKGTAVQNCTTITIHSLTVVMA